MKLMVANRRVPFPPQRIQIGNPRQSLPTEELRVYANRKHFLVVAAVEHPDPSPLWQMDGRTPQEIVIELVRGGRLVGRDLETGRVHTRRHGTDRRVLPRRVDRLKDQQERVAVGGVQPLLQICDVADDGAELRLRAGPVTGWRGIGAGDREVFVERDAIGTLGRRVPEIRRVWHVRNRT
jgi:hypothetical protein